MHFPPFVLGTKIQISFADLCDRTRHYATVRRDTSAASIRHNPAIRNFKDKRKALKDCRKYEEVKALKISKTL